LCFYKEKYARYCPKSALCNTYRILAKLQKVKNDLQNSAQQTEKYKDKNACTIVDNRFERHK